VPSIAVQLITSEGKSIRGILMADPKVGYDCRVYTGDQNVYSIPKIRGWIKLVESDYVILFDVHGERVRIEVIGRSEDFLP
jgi:hypothetical protein